MSSMISVIMMFAILLGNFTIMPPSSLQIRSGEIKFKAETKLNKPLDKKMTEEMNGMPLDGLSAEFDIKYKTSEDLKKLEMQCSMLLSNSIDTPMQILFWSNLDYSDKNIPKTLLVFKMQDDEKYHFINIQSPVINRGMNPMGMFWQLFNADMTNSVNRNISDRLNEKNFNIEEKNGVFSATMDEATLKEVIKQIALGVSEYMVPYFATNMMAYRGTTATKSVSVIQSNDDSVTDEKAERYRQRIMNESMKINGVTKVDCDVYLLEDGSYQADVSVEMSDDDLRIQYELQKIVQEIDGTIQLGTITYAAPDIRHDMNVTTQEGIKSQFKAAINEFFAKLENVKVFEKNALVLTMTLDDKKLPETVKYDINIKTNFDELSQIFGEDWNDEIPKESANLDMTVTFDYVYSKINEEITIDYPKLTAENSVDMMEGSSLPDIDVNAVNIVVNDKLTQLHNKPFIHDGVVYLPLREVLNLKGITDEYILWNDGIIEITSPDLVAAIEIDSDKVKRNNQIVSTGAKALLQGGSTYIPVAIFTELGIGGLTNTFFDKSGNIIGCVISIYKSAPRSTRSVSFLIPDSEPIWEEYLYKAGDMAGVNVSIIEASVDNYIERTNLMIAAGEPAVMIGKYSDEFINKMLEMNVIYPIISVNDEYSAIVPDVFKNTDPVFEVIKNFIGLVNQK